VVPPAANCRTLDSPGKHSGEPASILQCRYDAYAPAAVREQQSRLLMLTALGDVAFLVREKFAR
jgi:hypothetical protein